MSNVTSTNDSSETKKNYFVNYNQDITSIAVGSPSGFRLYSLNNVDDLELIYDNDAEDTSMVERLFSSSLVSLVAISAPRKLKVCHFKKGTEICNYSYSNTILAVRMNRSRLVVCLEESLYIHNIRDMKVLHTIRDTPPNRQGLCALTICNENCLLAYPGSASIGEVQIFDAYNLHAKTMIPAHDSPLAAIAFNSTGTKIATASEKGTVIRVFNTNDGGKLYEFRRGVKRCVDICSLAFSICGQYLCCSSNTETVHIFKVEEPRESSPGKVSEDTSWMGYLSSYLPPQVTGVFTQGRAFATAHLPVSGVRNVVAITTVQNQIRLLVATEEAILYVYNLDTNEGGDLTLYKQHRLDDARNSHQKGSSASEPQNIDVGWTVQAVVKSTGKMERKAGARTPYWWNDVIQKIRRETISIRRKITRQRKRQEQMERIEEEYKEKKRQLKQEIRKAKREAWKELCEEVNEDLWGNGYSIVIKKMNRTGPPLKLEEDDVKEIIRELFPTQEKRQEESIEEEKELEDITTEEIIQAVKSMKMGRAPGPDGIPPEAVKALVDEEPEYVQRIIQHLESDKLREMVAATETPPEHAFHFNDDQEYPPLTQTTD